MKENRASMHQGALIRMRCRTTKLMMAKIIVLPSQDKHRINYNYQRLFSCTTINMYQFMSITLFYLMIITNVVFIAADNQSDSDKNDLNNGFNGGPDIPTTTEFGE